MNEVNVWFAEEASIYCLNCQAELPIGSESRDKCIKCWTEFDRDDPKTFSTQQIFVLWKYWWPGFFLAVLSGIISYAVCLQGGELGFALFCAVPVSVGAILGYGTRPGIWMSLLMAVFVIPAIVLPLVSMHFAGFFCGITLGIIFIMPTLFGILLGVVLRTILTANNWDQACFFPLIFFIALPYLVQAIECSVPNRTEVATVRTELTVDATPEEAWNAIMFYEDVEHSPPWLLRFALPQPVRSEGNKQREGEIVRCFYDRGYLVKRISRVEQNRELAFEVTEQKLHFERDVTLKNGSFELIPISDTQTKIVLSTRYERHLSPRFVWRPIESTVVHTLHEHVLEGMRRHIDQTRLDEFDGGNDEPGKVDPYVPSPSTNETYQDLASHDATRQSF